MADSLRARLAAMETSLKWDTVPGEAIAFLLRVAAAYATECERHEQQEDRCYQCLRPWPCPTVRAREAVER